MALQLAVSATAARNRKDEFDITKPGYCTPKDFVCDVGTNSSMPQFNSINGVAIDQLECDVPIATILNETNVLPGGLAEDCMITLTSSNSETAPNVGDEFPKAKVCCPMVEIPIQTQNDGNQIFHFYDDGELVKIY